MVVPIALYHGAERWSAPRAFEALFSVPDAARAALASQLVRFTYLLDDLSVISDAELRERSMTALGRVVELCLKHARTRADVLDILVGWADLVREAIAAPDGLEAMAQVLPILPWSATTSGPRSSRPFWTAWLVPMPRTRS